MSSSSGVTTSGASTTASSTSTSSQTYTTSITGSTATHTACRAILDQHQVYVIPQGDPDIAGIGVIVSFLSSAGLVLLAALFSYRLGLIHKDLLNTADRLAYGARSTGSERWRGAVDKFILAFSDQQIITGIAILIAGYAQWNTVDVYHWQVVVYLAWMSSNTHLTTLTVLRLYLQKRYTLKTWRIGGMAIMLVLLLVAFVPTSSSSWLLAVSQEYYESVTPSRKTDFHSAGNPAHCYWHRGFFTGINIDAPFSYCIVLCSYLWKASSLYDTKGRMRRIYRDAPINFLGRSVLNQARQIPHQDFRIVYKPRVFWYRVLVAHYVGWICVVDFLESFLASLWALFIYFVWGALVLFDARNDVPSSTRAAENQWSFGQVLPMMLLILPVVAVAEHFFRDRDLNDSAEIREFVEPVLNRKEVTYDYDHAEIDDDYSPPLVPADLTLSGYLKTVHFVTTPEQETVSREYLYKSKFFLSLHVWINVFLFVGSLAVFLLEGLSAAEHLDFLKGYLWLPVACLVALALVWWFVWMTLGLFISGLFR